LRRGTLAGEKLKNLRKNLRNHLEGPEPVLHAYPELGAMGVLFTLRVIFKKEETVRGEGSAGGGGDIKSLISGGEGEESFLNGGSRPKYRGLGR